MKKLTSDDYKLIELWVSGVSLTKIAKEFQISKNTVLLRLSELEVSCRDSSTVRQNLYISVVCKQCGKDFLTRRHKKSSVYCRFCQEKLREANPSFTRLDKYGVTKEQYEEMIIRQNALCAICKNPETTRNRSLAIDHCHKTGQVRELLCGKCNRALGLFKDSIPLLNEAANYLTKHACPENSSQ